MMLSILETGEVLATRVLRPQGWRRHLGLLVMGDLAPGEALQLDPCGGVHTFGLRQSIDVLFVTQTLELLLVRRALRPARICLAPRLTAGVIELPAGGAGGARRGQRLILRQPEMTAE